MKENNHICVEYEICSAKIFECSIEVLIPWEIMTSSVTNSEKNWHVPCLTEERDTFLR